MRCNAMAASYKKLFKLLIDRDMKKKELAEKAGISIATITKMGKDGADFCVGDCFECCSGDFLQQRCGGFGCAFGIGYRLYARGQSCAYMYDSGEI